jgi:hypothetical protein
MVLRKIFPVLLILLISGCASVPCSRRSSVDDEKVRTFASIYRRSKEVRKVDLPTGQEIKLMPDAGYDTPYFPVYEPGRVEKVWVPAHVAREDKDVLVAGHWTFVVVDAPHWYIEDHGMNKVDIPVVLPTAPRKE